MAKVLTEFVCQSCGAKYNRWQGRCNACGEWNTLVEEINEQQNSSEKRAYSKPGKLEKLVDVKSSEIPRIKTALGEFDRVLGGGIVPGSLVLLGGDPGIGKSTLILQIAEKIACNKAKVLYASGEESSEQIKIRAERLGVVSENLMVLPETNIEAIITSAQGVKPALLIIDSIQTMFSNALSGAAGSVGQVTLATSKLMDFGKKNRVAIFIVGHVTKEGSIAGPKILEHLVDTVLYLEGDKLADLRILKGIKNRFGSTNETGVFEMGEKGLSEVENPSANLLSEKANAQGSVVFPAMEGTRPILVEIQALTNLTNFGYPKRTASGFDLNRLNLLVAVLSKRAGINLSNQDVYVNVVGGLKISEPALDLAVCMAIASSYKNKALSKETCAFGEVGLSGEIRAVQNAKERIKEAEKLGYKKCITPKIKELKSMKTVSNLTEAIREFL